MRSSGNKYPLKAELRGAYFQNSHAPRALLSAKIDMIFYWFLLMILTGYPNGTCQISWEKTLNPKQYKAFQKMEHSHLHLHTCRHSVFWNVSQDFMLCKNTSKYIRNFFEGILEGFTLVTTAVGNSSHMYADR